jgi:hypothetical protein
MSFMKDTALDVVLQLIISDGEKTRSSRRDLFNPDFQTMGLFTGSHKQYKVMTSLVYATLFIAPGAVNPK